MLAATRGPSATLRHKWRQDPEAGLQLLSESERTSLSTLPNLYLNLTRTWPITGAEAGMVLVNQAEHCFLDYTT